MMVVAEMKSQFPFAVEGTENVGDIALNAVLPDVFFQSGKNCVLPSALKRTAPVNSPRTGPSRKVLVMVRSLPWRLRNTFMSSSSQVLISTSTSTSASGWSARNRLKARQREVVIAGGEHKRHTVEQMAGDPHAAEDAGLFVEGIQNALGASADSEADGEGVEADDDRRIGDVSLLEVGQNGGQDRFAAEIEQDLIAFVAEIL